MVPMFIFCKILQSRALVRLHCLLHSSTFDLGDSATNFMISMVVFESAFHLIDVFVLGHENDCERVARKHVKKSRLYGTDFVFFSKIAWNEKSGRKFVFKRRSTVHQRQCQLENATHSFGNEFVAEVKKKTAFVFSYFFLIFASQRFKTSDANQRESSTVFCWKATTIDGHWRRGRPVWIFFGIAGNESIVFQTFSCSTRPWLNSICRCLAKKPSLAKMPIANWGKTVWYFFSDALEQTIVHHAARRSIQSCLERRL